MSEACNPSYLGGRDWEDAWFKASPGKEISQNPMSISGWTQWHASVNPAMLRNTNRRMGVQASPGAKQDLISKIINAKMAA
jgi:hypothetical protein